MIGSRIESRENPGWLARRLGIVPGRFAKELNFPSFPRFDLVGRADRKMVLAHTMVYPFRELWKYIPVNPEIGHGNF
jgi:hypothetical protein